MYKKMYQTMFKAMKEALLQMEQQNYGVAKAMLMRAQFECESLYIDAENAECTAKTDKTVENDI